MALRAWYKSVWRESSIGEWAQMLGAAESAIARGISGLVALSRGDSDKQRRLVTFAVTWRRDFLKEDVGLGIFGWFAAKEKKDAAWEKKVRDELGL